MQKPLDINEPTVVPSNNEEYLEIIAFMLISSTHYSIPEEEYWIGGLSEYADMDRLTFHKKPRIEPSTKSTIGSGTKSDMNAAPRLYLRDGQGETAPSEKDFRRWQLAYQAIIKAQILRKDQAISIANFVHEHLTASGRLKTPDYFHNALTIHSSAISRDEVLEVFILDELFRSGKWPLLALWLLPVAYGGIHLAAWGFEFPSPAESLLWKIACLIIMSALFILAALSSIILWIPNLNVPYRVKNIVHRMSIAVFLIGFSIYALARIFIVVESFLSLRHVPIGVYAAVPWVQNIPHI